MPKKALLIGCNYIRIPQISLRGCVDDVVNMQNMLINKYNYLNSDITVLRDDVNIAYKLPTKQNIIQNLKYLVNQSAVLDEIWIHYSGHGTVAMNGQTDSVGVNDSAIIPLDYQRAGLITEDEIFAIIKNIKCPAILLFDSCNSGNICDMPWRFEVNPVGKIAISRSLVKIQNPNIYVFSGCKESQTSADAFDNEIVEYVGAFTASFLKCLRANNSDIPIYQFYKNVFDYMKVRGFSQQPILTASSNKLNKIITKTIQDNKTNGVFRNPIISNMRSFMKI